MNESEPLSLHLFSRRTSNLREIIKSFFPSRDFLSSRAFVSRAAPRTIFLNQFARRATMRNVIAIISHETLHAVLLSFGDEDAAVVFTEGGDEVKASFDTASVCLDDMARKKHDSFPGHDGLYSKHI